MKDVVRIHRLELDCIVGIRPHEREHQQRVRLDLGLHADLSAAGRTGRISLTADYDQVAHEVAALLAFRHYHLIEMAAEEVSAMLLGIHTGVRRVDLRIEKPGALEGRARAASIEVRRTRHDFPVAVLGSAEGRCELLLETREARLELVHLQPGQSNEGGPGFAARALCWVVQGEVETGQGPLGPCLPSGIISPSEPRARIHNPGPESACLFRCWTRIP